MRFQNAFAAIAVAVSAVVVSAAFQPAEAATTTYNGAFSTPATINAGDTALLINGATVTGTGVITANGTLQVNQTGTTLEIYSSKIAGTGTFSLTNTGTVYLGGAQNVALDLTTSVSAGRLNAASVLSIGQIGAGTLNVSGAGGHVFSPFITLGYNAGSVGSVTVSSGTLETSGGSNYPSLSIGRSGSGTFNLSGGYVKSGVYTSLGGFMLGELVGGVGTGTVSSGTWDSNSSVIGGAGTGTLTVNAGRVNSFLASIGDRPGGVGSVSVSSGTFSTSQIYVGYEGTGTLTINNGGLVSVESFLKTLVTAGTASIVNINAGGTLNMNGIFGSYDPNNPDLTAKMVNNGTIILDNLDPTWVMVESGTISGTGSVTKQGDGMWLVDGSHSYTGPTNVDAGGLFVNGLLGNTAVTVNAGGLLGGRGTILGNVTVASSGTIAPHDATFDFLYQALTVGSLSLSTNSYTVLDISGTTPLLNEYDQLVGSGAAAALTYGGNLDLLLSGSYADGTTWNLFSNFLTKNGDFADVNLNATGEYAGLTFTSFGGVWTSTKTANNQYLEFTPSTGNLVVVPEPSTIAMTLAGLACGSWQMVRRRRQLRQAASLSA